MPVSHILLNSDKTKLYCANISAFRALKFLEDINIFLGGWGGGGESELSHAQSFALSKTHTIFIRL